MSKIGTFSKELEQNPTHIDFNGQVAEWINDRGIKITITVEKDMFMERPEYWILFEYDGNYGGGPDANMVYGTKQRAYNKAYDIMKHLAENPGKIQEYIIY